MTATSPARFAPEYMTSDVTALLAQVEAGRIDVQPILADALEDAGYADETDLAAMRSRTWQVTEEGAEVATVGRYGATTANCGNGITRPIYCTKVYRAARRADGVLTWRLNWSLADGTAGIGITAPMVARARNFAEERGLPFVARVRHGRRCK